MEKILFMDNNAKQTEPHGGRLINLLVDAERAALLKEISMNLPDLTLNERQLCDLELLATGARAWCQNLYC